VSITKADELKLRLVKTLAALGFFLEEERWEERKKTSRFPRPFIYHRAFYQKSVNDVQKPGITTVINVAQ
jgi:hypothetical protein